MSEPFGNDRRKPTGRVPKARKVLGGGGLADSPSPRVSCRGGWLVDDHDLVGG